MTKTKALTTRTQKKGRAGVGLTPRERTFIREYVSNGGNQMEAAFAAGFGSTRKSAATIANRLLNRVEIQLAIRNALTKAGLDDESLFLPLREGLKAYKVSWVEDKSVPGGWRELRAPDFQARSKYLDIAYRLRGDYAPTRHEVDAAGLLAKFLENVDRLDRGEEPLFLPGAEVIDADYETEED